MLHTPMNIGRIDKLVQFVIPDGESVVAESRNVVVGNVCSFGRDRDDAASVVMVTRITTREDVRALQARDT